jgi:hypothetical protein
MVNKENLVSGRQLRLHRLEQREQEREQATGNAAPL